MSDKEKLIKDNISSLLWLWKSRASKAANAHYFASDIYTFRNTILTAINVLSAIAVLFLINFEPVVKEYSVLVNIAGLLTVLSTALQHILNYHEQAYKHKSLGNEYSNIKRKIERLILSDDFDKETAHRMSLCLNWLAKSSPGVKRSIFKKSISESRKGIDDVSTAEKKLIESLKNLGFDINIDDADPKFDTV